MKDYNGFANYQTWNVALWIQNDEYLYEIAKMSSDYREFKYTVRDSGHLLPPALGVWIGHETPDGVPWKDSAIDTAAIDDIVAEMKG